MGRRSERKGKGKFKRSGIPQTETKTEKLKKNKKRGKDDKM